MDRIVQLLIKKEESLPRRTGASREDRSNQRLKSWHFFCPLIHSDISMCEIMSNVMTTCSTRSRAEREVSDELCSMDQLYIRALADHFSILTWVQRHPARDVESNYCRYPRTPLFKCAGRFNHRPENFLSLRRAAGESLARKSARGDSKKNGRDFRPFFCTHG